MLDFGTIMLAGRVHRYRMGAVTYTPHSEPAVYDPFLGGPMSPEQCRNLGDADDKADVYALGLVLYRMLAGKPPFSASGIGELMAMHIYMPPPPLQELNPAPPAPLAHLVHQMLAKKRNERPPMVQIEADLARLTERDART